MKAFISTAAILVSLLVWPVQAAHLTSYDGGGLWGQVDRYLNDTERLVGSSPLSDSSPASVAASISEYSLLSTVEGSMTGMVTSASYWEDGLGTAVVMNARAFCTSTDAMSDLWAYGNVSAVVPTVTGGIFFLVEGDSGEPAGTPVRMHWRWSAQVPALSGNATASVGGETIYLTRNVTPPVDIPSGDMVWSRDGVAAMEATNMEETGSFIAQVGDIIGVFNSAGATASLVGEGESVAVISTSMELLAVTLPTLIEYPYAPGLVYDPDQNITFLKDWSTAAGPMNWADADAWARDFNFTSNGITYSNWRLPKTIDTQGAAVGELGYLSTQYGISEAYFGPFQNLSAGDYWTGPQFSRDPDPAISYVYTFSTTYGPAQWYSPPGYDNSWTTPVFDGPPQSTWCPADFNNDGIVDFTDFAIFASYWLHQRSEPM